MLHRTFELHCMSHNHVSAYAELLPARDVMSWGADFACSTELLKLDEIVALS